MKKLVALLLTLIMFFSVSATAFAEEESTPTVNYKAYRLMTLSSSLKNETDHPTNCNNTDHTDACYNYRYEFNDDDKYKSILQKEVLSSASVDFWPNSIAPAESSITAEDVAKFLETHSSDTGTSYGSVRQVADRLYRRILADDQIEPDFEKETLEEITEAINNPAAGTDTKGYWMIADVRDVNNAVEDANALVLMDTKGEFDMQINMNTKISYPTVEKMVKDIEDSEDSDISPNPWWRSADHDIDDMVIFKVASTLPNNLRAYDEYELIFHDTMDPSLVLDPTTIQVRMYETHNAAHVDTNMQGGTLVDAQKYHVETSGLTDGCTFEVVFDDVKEISGVGSGYTIVVYYKAKLTGSAVKFGEEGNTNTAFVEYSNNPYGEGTGKTEPVQVKVFTYKLEIKKTDGFQKPLKGAEFTLYKYTLEPGKIDADTTDPMEKQGYIVVPMVGAANADRTTFEWAGLDDGDYILKETKVPEGYNGLKDIVFSISADHTGVSGDPKLTSLSSGDLDGTITLSGGVISETIENKAGAVLPETGARGTMLLIGCSSMLVMIAAVFMVTRKKMSIYED